MKGMNPTTVQQDVYANEMLYILELDKHPK